MAQNGTQSVEEIFHGLEQKTMKWSSYFQVYEELLAPFVGKPVTIVEVGVLNGGSLHMWRRFLGEKARVIGVDNSQGAKQMEAQGFEIFVGDQASGEFWADFFDAVGPVDVIVDDGGHTNKQQIATVTGCLEHINDGGMIITEDTHTSYMKHFGNPSKFSFMNYSKHIADCIQSRNPLVENMSRNAFRDSVYAVNFYESIVALRVDRRRCQPARHILTGTEHIDALDCRHANHWGASVDRLESALAAVPTEGLKKAARLAIHKMRGKLLQAQMMAENAALKRHFHPVRLADATCAPNDTKQNPSR